MVDSNQVKRANGNLDDMDNKLQNKTGKKRVEDETIDAGKNKHSVDVSQKEPTTPQTNESLDYLLRFDAKVLASSPDGKIHSNNDDTLVKDQQSNTSVDAIDAEGVAGQAKKLTVIPDETVNIDPESNASGDTQDNFSMDTTDRKAQGKNGNAQDKKISKLETELADMNLRIEVQSEFIIALKKAEIRAKIINIISLVFAFSALVMSNMYGISGVSDQQLPQKQVLSEKQPVLEKKQVSMQEVDSSSGSPVVESGTEIHDVEQIKTTAPETETNNLAKSLILPDDDIAELHLGDDAKKSATSVAIPKSAPSAPVPKSTMSAPVPKEDTNVKVPVNKWVVNLNSYQQRWETDKRIKELKQNDINPEVVIVNVKGVQWFRIRVTGFKTKTEAESYAAKIKKTLNIALAWVSKI